MARKAYNGYTEKSYYDNTKFSGVVTSTDALNEGYFKELINLDISDTGSSVKPRKGFLTTTVYYPEFDIDNTIISDNIDASEDKYTTYYYSVPNSPESVEIKVLTNFHSFDSTDADHLCIRYNSVLLPFIDITYYEGYKTYTYSQLRTDFKYYKSVNDVYEEVNNLPGTYISDTDIYYIKRDGSLHYICIIYDGLPFTYEAQVMSIDITDINSAAKHAGNITSSGMLIKSATPILMESESTELNSEYTSFKLTDSATSYWTQNNPDKDISTIQLPLISELNNGTTYTATVEYLIFSKVHITMQDENNVYITQGSSGERFIYIPLYKINSMSSHFSHGGLFNSLSYNNIGRPIRCELIDSEDNKYSVYVRFDWSSFTDSSYSLFCMIMYESDNSSYISDFNSLHDSADCMIKTIEFDVDNLKSFDVYHCSSGSYYELSIPQYEMKTDYYNVAAFSNMITVALTNAFYQISSNVYPDIDTCTIATSKDNDYYYIKAENGFVPFCNNKYVNIDIIYKDYKINTYSAGIRYVDVSHMFRFAADGLQPLLTFVDVCNHDVFVPSDESLYVPVNGEFVLPSSNNDITISKITLQNMDTHPSYLSPYILEYNNARNIIDLTNVKLSPRVVQLKFPIACKSIPENFAYDPDKVVSCNLSKLQLPYCCTVIHSNAFRNCPKLNSVSFPSKIQYIHDSAFRNCDLLGDIVFSESLFSIGAYAFKNSVTSVDSITFSSDVTIDTEAFYEFNSTVKHLASSSLNTQAFGSDAEFIKISKITVNIDSSDVCLKYNDDNVISYTITVEGVPTTVSAVSAVSVQLQVIDARYLISKIASVSYLNSNNQYVTLDSSCYDYNKTELVLSIKPVDNAYYRDYKIVPTVELIQNANRFIYINDIIIHRSGTHTILLDKKTFDGFTNISGYVYNNMDTDLITKDDIHKYALHCDNVVINVDYTSVVNYCKRNSNIYGDTNVLGRLYIPDGDTRVTTPMINEYRLTRGLIRVRFRKGDNRDATDPQLILAITYRADAVVGSGTVIEPQYPANSILIEAINTQEQYSFSSANVASFRSIIPADVDKQVIYTPEEIRDNGINGFVNQFNFLYVRDNDTNKYLNIYALNLDVTIIPYYQYINPLTQGELELSTSEDGDVQYIIRTIKHYNNDLLYTYKIISTQNLISNPDTTSSEVTYFGPVCKLTDNENVSSVISSNGDYNEGVDDLAEASASHTSIFTFNSSGVLQCNFGRIRQSDPVMRDLDSKGFFMNGLHIEFYIIQAPYTAYINSVNLINGIESDVDTEIYNVYAGLMTNTSLLNSATVQSQNIILTTIPGNVTYIDSLVTDNYDDKILHADGMLVFKPVEGDRLIFWKDNLLFMSEPNTTSNTEGFFKNENVFTFDEPIIKAITYKTLVLVFTTQTLYAVYPFTDTTAKEQTDAEGNTSIVQEEYVAYAKLPVLYNILCSKKYSDAIQVYNQMILFYSSDGQMFLIKPSTTIDSDTRFTLQYFNKSVNDVLLNYDKYINERVKYYKIALREVYPEYSDAILNDEFSIPKQDIQIKVQSNINYIKVYYYVPGVITYILVYNVLSNYWYMYDTVAFTSIQDILYIQSGDLFITKENNTYYLTFQYTDANRMDNNCDMSIYNSYTKEPIRALLDTGNLNLNNHLRKRFRDLHITYKNLNASKLKYNFDIIVDDALVDSNLQSTIFDIKEVNGITWINPMDYSTYINLLEDETLLLDLSSFTSNKIIKYTTNITTMGNVIRFKLYLESNGSYKVVSYGLVYKERTV